MNTIKQKIFISFICLLVFPLSLVTSINYFKSAQAIEKKTASQLKAVANLASQQIDRYFIDIENLSSNISNNSVVLDRLNQPYVPVQQWTIADLRQQERMRTYLKGISELKPGIASIVVYGRNGIVDFYHPTHQWNSSFSVEQESWYRKAAEAQGRWILSGRREDRQLIGLPTGQYDDVITFARLIRSTETLEPLGILAIHIHIDILHNLVDLTLSSSSSLKILDDEGRIVISGGNHDGNEPDQEGLAVTMQSPYTNWRSTLTISRNELFRETKEIRNFIVAFTVLLLLIAVVMAHFLSQGIVKPIQKLREKMKRVESGELSSEGESVGNDEIGELTRGFDRMLAHIRSLIETIKQEQKQRLHVELRALQAQINPHFMYNTLNGMQWVAMMDGNKKLAGYISAFVNLLKFSAKHSGSFITINNEITHLKDYVALMKMRNDQFEFRVYAEEKALSLLCVPFLLQPAVENAIFHGAVPAKFNVTIEVHVYVEGEVVWAIVRDNGVGMDDATLHNLLSESAASRHFNKIGLLNVRDRLKLHYGEKAGIDIWSAVGSGTVVKLHWPIQTEDERSPS